MKKGITVIAPYILLFGSLGSLLTPHVIQAEKASEATANGNQAEDYDYDELLDELDDEVGIESLYPRGEELGPFLVQSQKNSNEGIWTFAAEKGECSEFIMSPTQKGIDSKLQVAFFWYNNTPNHPDYSSSTKGGWIKKHENKWYPMTDVLKGTGRLVQVRYNDANHTTRGSNRHHNFQMKFRVHEDGKWRILGHRQEDQRPYVRFLMSSARPEILPGEFDGERGRNEPFYTENEWETLLKETKVIQGEEYDKTRTVRGALQDINDGIKDGSFTLEEVKAEIARQISGSSQQEEQVGSQSAALAALVAAARSAASDIGQNLIVKGIEAVTQGIINFFKSIFGAKCVENTIVSDSDDILIVTLKDKGGT